MATDTVLFWPAFLSARVPVPEKVMLSPLTMPVEVRSTPTLVVPS